MNEKGINTMLLQFRVKNFKSIGEEVVLDMTAGRCNEHKNFLVTNNSVDILTVASIYGANASGKSNIIDAISTMFYIVQDGGLFINRPDKSLITPFSFNKELSESPTEFEIYFSIDNTEYKYGFIMNNEKIFEEWLYERELSKTKKSFNGIFERRENSVEFKNPEGIKGLKGYVEFLNNNRKILTLVPLFNSGDKIAESFKKIHNWFYSFLIDFGGNKHLKRDIETVAKYYYDDPTAKEEFVAFMKEFDSTFEKIEIDIEEINGKKKYKVYSMHMGKRYSIDIESEGTQKLFTCFIWFFKYFNTKRGLFLADELDSHLHPLILRRIVAMFHDPKINKTGSQLVFSSHNLIVLDNREMRRDEIWFTEKDVKGFTKLYCLAEFKTNEEAIRHDLNFGKHYLSGRFGAIPYQSSEE